MTNYTLTEENKTHTVDALIALTNGSDEVAGIKEGLKPARECVTDFFMGMLHSDMDSKEFKDQCSAIVEACRVKMELKELKDKDLASCFTQYKSDGAKFLTMTEDDPEKRPEFKTMSAIKKFINSNLFKVASDLFASGKKTLSGKDKKATRDRFINAANHAAARAIKELVDAYTDAGLEVPEKAAEIVAEWFPEDQPEQDAPIIEQAETPEPQQLGFSQNVQKYVEANGIDPEALRPFATNGKVNKPELDAYLAAQQVAA